MEEIIAEGKTAKQLRAEKEKRIHDAIALRIPDRVPIICGMGYFPAKNMGIPSSAAYYDFDTWYNAYKTTIKDYQADLIYPQNFSPGKAMEILEPKSSRWPGFGVDPYKGHQSIELENMKADEYDYYFNDMSDYALRVNIPRSSDKLAGLAKLPPLSGLMGMGGAQMLAMALTDPEVESAIKTLQEAGRELRKHTDKMPRFAQMLNDMGFPTYFQGAAMPPFDGISISMRGMQGAMMDMFRQPDKLIAMAEKNLERTLSMPISLKSENGYRRYFMTVTRGSADFLSNEQFDRFYWPTFRRLVHHLIKNEVTPCIFFEGNFTPRLEYLLDFPKGSFLARIDTTDIYKARDILKDHVCIQGNVPSSLLLSGSVQDVKDYCKTLIDDIGKDGGFILSPRSSTDEVKPENLKAMIDFTHEYGVYR